MNAQELTGALGGCWRGMYGTAKCPAHDDRWSSLKVITGKSGKLIILRFSGAGWRDEEHSLHGELLRLDLDLRSGA